MDNSIVVDVSELRSLIQDVRRSGMDIVELTIYPATEEDGEVLPSTLNFSASRKADSSTWIDFDELEAVEIESDSEEKSSFEVHMSDNLL